jgi:ParB-like chromosome segregation protein Spo0J
MDTATSHDAEILPEIDNAQPATADHQHPAPAIATMTLLDLDLITERDRYTRALRPDHVEHLAASIAAIGLEQPLVLIAGNQLVAGRHRYHALRLLRDQDPDGFVRLFPTGEVPVNVFDLGEQPDPAAVLALELTENNARADYSDAEIAATIDQLKASGYTCRRGRPGKGDRPIGPVLMRLFGMSKATMLRALRVAGRGEKVSCDTITEGEAKPRGKRVAAGKLSHERVSEAGEEEQPAVADPLAEARSAVEQMTLDQFGEFVRWFTAHHRHRLG